MARFRNHLGKESAFTRIDPKVIQDKTISRWARFVYTLLCSYAKNDGREAWPSIERLTEDMGYAPSSRKASKFLTELVDLGIVIREPRPGNTTIYHLNPTITKPGGCVPNGTGGASLMAQGCVPNSTGRCVPNDTRTRCSELDEKTRGGNFENEDSPEQPIDGDGKKRFEAILSGIRFKSL